MPIEDFIIHTYCLVHDFLQPFEKFRQRGPAPHLIDAEVITMEMVGEFLELGSDKSIFEYFKRHWVTYFPNLGSRTTFIRQSAKLWCMKDRLHKHLVHQMCPVNDLFLFDGFPIPTCHLKRVRHKNPLWGEAGFGYCAAKDEKYFGFKGHLLTHQHGLIFDFTFTAANIDERDILPELAAAYQGIVIADKGLIRPELTATLAAHDLNLQTPLRSNMKDSRPKALVCTLMNVRRKIETVIGQLVKRFTIQSIRTKDLWHLSVKTGRKILAHTFAFFIVNSLEFDKIIS